MADHDFKRLLADAAGALLESMFYTAPYSSVAEADPETGALEAHVAFRGELSGRLGVRVSAASARSLAASFLGEEEDSVSRIQTSQIVCELANMLCGWLVSQLEEEQHFDLGSPELLDGEGAKQSGIPPAAEESFAIENGILNLALYLEDRG